MRPAVPVTFIWPIMLVLLVVIPLLVGLYIRLQRRRRRLAERYGQLGFGPGVHRPAPGFSRHLPPALFFTGLTILVVSLARPQTVVNLPRIEGTGILAFDVSGSMAAEDLKPTRIEAATAAPRAVIERPPATA